MKIRLTSHNTFWFQGVPFGSEEPGGPKPEVLEGLIAAYRALDPSLLCLQEIQSAGCAQGVGEMLGMVAVYCPGARRPQYGGAVLCSNPICSVVDWRSSAHHPDRFWQVVELDVGVGRLRVANLHLPSNRHLEESDAERARLVELAHLLGGPSPPEMVCGDFNERPVGPAHRLTERAGYRDAALLAGLDHCGTSSKNPAKRIDYIWLAPELAEHLEDYRVVPPEALRVEHGALEFLSDHLPVSVTLEL